MNYSKVIAGIFAGIGGLMSLYLGVTHNQPELLILSTSLLSGMLGFFVGEANGKRMK